MISVHARLVVVLLCALSLVLGAVPAKAGISDCIAMIDNLKTALDGAEIGGRNAERTRAGLESKLEGAKIKIDQLKVCDAVQKLEDFRNSVESLGTPNAKGQSKMDPDTAQSLVADANDAIDCLLGLAPECG